MPEELTLVEAKKAFWENVVNPKFGCTRFVCKVIRWGTSSIRGDLGGEYSLFVPQSWNDDYDMVTTLGVDGLTYPLYDLDTVEQAENARRRGMMVWPSMSNWGAADVCWQHWQNYLTDPLFQSNEGYAAMNSPKGWAGLRAPWVSKDGIVPSRWRQPDLWTNVSFSNREQWREPEEPAGVSLEDLFGEES